VNGHCLNLHFCMFEKSQGNIIIWIVINVFEIFSINYKVYIFKSSQIFLFFAHSKTQTLKVDNPCFFLSFFLPNV